uniref:Uncharacterized protein n=1 Tax=Graphocephala atropunctata TaxID=36148 RepID=A0A1B6MFD1_9HEMI
MDPLISLDTEENMSSLTTQFLDLKPGSQKGGSLSNLTAKYNRPRNSFGLMSNEIERSKHCIDKDGSYHITARNNSKSPKYNYQKQPRSSDLNTVHNSSEEDSSDSEFSGLSLAGLAAKHKVTKANDGACSFIPKTNKNISVNKLLKLELTQKFEDSSEKMSSINDGMSLLDLTAGYKARHSSHLRDGESEMENRRATSLGPRHDCIDFHKTENETSKMKTSTDKSLKTILSKQDYELTGGSNTKVASFNYVTSNFPEDSDSDDSFSLAGLVLKRVSKVSQSDQGSAENMSHDASSTHLPSLGCSLRQHTKSESDRFSAGALSSEMLIKRGFENETPTSLGSLRGSSGSLRGSSQPDSSDFQFSLGCSLPGSFRTKGKDNNLASSLGSIRVAKAGLSSINSFSDPNVSVKQRSKVAGQTTLNLCNSSVTDHRPRTHRIDIPSSGGIDLSCAIKSPSSTRVSESMESECDTDISCEPEIDEIITLLDAESTMGREEGEVTSLLQNLHFSGDTIDSSNAIKGIIPVKIKLEDSCIFDASNILKLELKLRTTKCSSFGKVVCKKWRLSKIPYIRQKKFQTTVIPFDFSTFSPDDELASLRRRKSFLT